MPRLKGCCQWNPGAWGEARGSRCLRNAREAGHAKLRICLHRKAPTPAPAKTRAEWGYAAATRCREAGNGYPADGPCARASETPGWIRKRRSVLRPALRWNSESDDRAFLRMSGLSVPLGSWASGEPQKLTTLDSEIMVANLMGSMNEAFKLFRSCSVTPRATLQAPQTYTGIFAFVTFSISSGKGGKPTP